MAGNDAAEPAKTNISLYEFYALGIERLVERAPWELERAVSRYHERFLTEQRCIGLTILLLLGEDHVPEEKVSTMPGFEEQARISVNQAVFLRALKHYFESHKLNPTRADMVFERMHNYLADARAALANKNDAIDAMVAILVKRVPPKDDQQAIQYSDRARKIFEYVEGLVNGSLLTRYVIAS